VIGGVSRRAGVTVATIIRAALPLTADAAAGPLLGDELEVDE
jgi:hypothetical protein